MNKYFVGTYLKVSTVVLEKHHMEMTQCRSGRNIVNNSCRFQEKWSRHRLEGLHKYDEWESEHKKVHWEVY